jgi:hypothetical protein
MRKTLIAMQLCSLKKQYDKSENYIKHFSNSTTKRIKFVVLKDKNLIYFYLSLWNYPASRQKNALTVKGKTYLAHFCKQIKNRVYHGFRQNLGKSVRWLFLCHFWLLLMWVAYFGASSILIGLSLKPNHHGQVKLFQVLDTYDRIFNKWRHNVSCSCICLLCVYICFRHVV